jgi:hypothetical protein
MRASDVEVIVLDRDRGDDGVDQGRPTFLVGGVGQVARPRGVGGLVPKGRLTSSPMADGTGVIRAMGLPPRVTT